MSTEQMRKEIEREIITHIGQGSTPLANLVWHITVNKKLTDNVALVGGVISDMFTRELLRASGFYPHPFDSRDLDVRIAGSDKSNKPIEWAGGC